MFRNSKSRRHGRPLAAMEPLESRAYFSVDLATSVSLVVPATAQVKTGSFVTLSVEVLNNGTTTAAGPLEIDPGISPNADGSSLVAFAPVSRHIAIKAGGHATIRLQEKVAFGTTPGTYFGVATVDPGNTFSETDLSNNSAVSSNSVVVVPKYPNLAGNYSGTGAVLRGTGKGLTFTQTSVISSEEPATGRYTITGTNFFAGGLTISFAGTGTVSPTGLVTQTTTDIPADATRVTHTRGKFAGNVSTYTFVNSSSSGTGSSTLESAG